MHFQRIRVLFPTSTLGGSKPLAAPVPGDDLILSYAPTEYHTHGIYTLSPIHPPHTYRTYTTTFMHTHTHLDGTIQTWQESIWPLIWGLSILLQQLTIYSNVHVLRCIIFQDILINTWEKPNCKVTRYFCYFQHLHEKHTVTLHMGTNA